MSGQPPGETLPRVQASADCGSTGGWYYDDNVAPTSITLCPESCTSIQQDPGASVKLELGCASDLF
jgi:hypothetical protein